MNAIPETAALLQAYRSARAALNTARLQAFPHRCCVRVNSARYRGVGVALTLCSEGVPLDELPVRLENVGCGPIHGPAQREAVDCVVSNQKWNSARYWVQFTR